MTTRTGSKIGVVLDDAFALAVDLRQKQEAVFQSQITDPDKEERRQRQFERSICNLGVFPQCRGIRIA